MRIKAALTREVNQLTVEEVELDPPKDTEVLVRMKAAGVCHSDLHTYRGELRATPPLVLGHEGAGVVEAVGRRVSRVKKGDRVTINWLPACETCPTCLNGRYNLCERLAGTTFKAVLLDGTTRLTTTDRVPLKHMLGAATMAEYAVVDEAGAVPVLDDVPFEVAAVIGCAVDDRRRCGNQYGSRQARAAGGSDRLRGYRAECDSGVQVGGAKPDRRGGRDGKQTRVRAWVGRHAHCQRRRRRRC